MKSGRIVGIAAVSLACIGGLWMASSRPSSAEGTSGTMVEVRQFEMACFPGKPGAKVRLTLVTGQAVEYRVEDSVEQETIGRLGAAFLGGGSRMFARVDGSSVLSVEVAGPFRP